MQPKSQPVRAPADNPLPPASEIGIFAFGRTQSARCPNKMLRPFGGTTLTDIVLAKLAAFGDRAFFAGYEPEFRAKCERHGVRFVQRDERSATIDEPIRDILSFLEAERSRYLLIVNGCLPFMETATIRGFLDDALRHREPAFAVTRRLNHFMSLDRRPLNFDATGRTINTKTVRPVYEFAHALYFFEREYFLREGRYWDWSTVRLVEAGSKRELLDIDTEEDFELCQALWRGLQGGAQGGPGRSEANP